ncbi:MAG: sporulation protein YqfD [Oscillospiraceae bacterium]
MYDFFNSLAGSVSYEVSGALPEGFLNACAKSGAELLSVRRLDEYTLLVRARARDRNKLEKAAVKAGCSLRLTGTGGSVKIGGVVKRRLVPGVCLLLLLALLFVSRLFIWEITVVGNETVPAGKILDVLSDCGVETGTFWPKLTADLVRSDALLQLPELSWLTVNIYGSRAEVLVRERVEKPEILSEDTPADIVAEKTGLVEEVRALIGTAEAQKGTAVLAGETLISGGAESTFSPPRLLHAWGSVTALTYYEFSAQIPVTEQVKSYTGGEKSRWSLVIGGERLNFYGNSSIYDASCDKITTVWDLGIEGLFRLPVSLVRQRSVFYELTERERDKSQARTELEEALHARLIREIGEDGEILGENFSASESGGVITVCLRARCREEIGVTVPMSEGRIAEIENNYIAKGEETND